MRPRTTRSKDQNKHEQRFDSATAQFPTTRIVLSVATLLHFTVTPPDVKAPNLQAKHLTTEKYMRSPRGRTKFIVDV